MQSKDNPSEKIELSILQRFTLKGWTLSTAESCTGGSIAARLTLIPGASKYYLGSIIAYSNEIKVKLLNVSTESIKQYGSVSKEVVTEMAKGILAQTGTDFAIAVSGIAGPTGGTPDKPVGTIWAAIVRKGEPVYAWKFQCSGNRDEIIDSTVNTLLSELLKRSLQT